MFRKVMFTCTFDIKYQQRRFENRCCYVNMSIIAWHTFWHMLKELHRTLFICYPGGRIWIQMSPWFLSFQIPGWDIQGEYVMIIKDKFSTVLLKNVCCGYSLESPRQGYSNAYQQQMFYGELWKMISKLSSDTHLIKWAASWQNQHDDLCAQRRLRSAWAFAQSESAWRNIKSSAIQWARCKDSDQTGRICRAVRMKKHWVLSYPLSALQRLWSDWADAQADLSLRWAHRSFCWSCHEVAQFVFLTSDDVKSSKSVTSLWGFICMEFYGPVKHY